MKRLYITPTLKSVVLEERLLETISGSNQGSGHNEGRPNQSKRKYFGYDFEDEYYDI